MQRASKVRIRRIEHPEETSSQQQRRGMARCLKAKWATLVNNNISDQTYNYHFHFPLILLFVTVCTRYQVNINIFLNVQQFVLVKGGYFEKDWNETRYYRKSLHNFNSLQGGSKRLLDRVMLQLFILEACCACRHVPRLPSFKADSNNVY